MLSPRSVSECHWRQHCYILDFFQQVSVRDSVVTRYNLHRKYDDRFLKIFYLLIENIDVVIAANNAGFEIADIFVTHDLSHLIIRKLIELHAKFFFENATKLHDFGWMEATFWLYCKSSCVHESVGDCEKLHLDLLICPLLQWMIRWEWNDLQANIAGFYMLEIAGSANWWRVWRSFHLVIINIRAPHSSLFNGLKDRIRRNE